MKIAISAESTIDLPRNLIEKYDINVIPYHITLGKEEMIDGNERNEYIFDYVNRTGILPKTSALNQYDYQEYFEKLLKNYDAVIHFCLSGGITSSCNNAINAAKELKNVYVVDTKTLSTGIALLALYARELSYDIDDPEEIYRRTLTRVDKVQASFVIERLDYLYKGGRCSSLALFGANLMKIRPSIILTSDGTMTSHKKYRGKMEAVVEKYCLDTLMEFNKPELKRVFITYSSATPEMVEKAKAVLAPYHFEEVIEAPAGCTITSHCGPNTLGIIYFNDVED